MNEKLNILFLSSWFPTKDRPTHGNFVKNHALAISKYHHVEVIYVAKSQNQKRKYIFEKTAEGNLSINQCYIKASKSRIKLIRFFSDSFRYLKAYYKLVHLLAQKPQLIHANIIFPIGFVALLLKYRLGLKYILTEHWSVLNDINKMSFWKVFFFKLILKNASYVLPVSKQLETSIEHITHKIKVKVIPNIVDTSLFNFKEKGFSDRFNWIHISTLDPIKNAEGIVRVFKKLIEIDCKNHLTIVSDGDSSSLLNLINELKLSKDNYKIIGASSYEEIANYLKKSDACVQFSHSETFGIVAAEALCCGTPIISTRVGFLKNVDENLVGKFVKINDEDDLLNKMQLLKTEKFDTKSSSLYFSNLYNAERIATAYSDIYKKVLNR